MLALVRGGSLTQQVDDALHEDDNRHEPDAVVGARAAQQTIGEREDRLLRHPRLAGARPGAHEHRQCRVQPHVAVGRGLEQKRHKVTHVAHIPLGRDA